MPNCINFTKFQASEPTVLNRIDEELCEHLGVEVQSTTWVHNWFNTVAFSLACGNDWNKVREIYRDTPELIKIIDYLEEHYEVNSWWEPK